VVRSCHDTEPDDVCDQHAAGLRQSASDIVDFQVRNSYGHGKSSFDLSASMSLSL
jgi:hypothetical protein